MSTWYTRRKVKIDYIHNKIMGGIMCYVGLALTGGILATLLGVGWYGDRKEKSVNKRPKYKATHTGIPSNRNRDVVSTIYQN